MNVEKPVGVCPIARGMLTLAFVIAALPVFAQPVNINVCDTTAHLLVTQYAAFLQTSEAVTIDSVLSVQSHFQKPPDKPLLVAKYDPYYYWFRFVFRNSADKSRELMLLMAPFGMYDGRLFQKVDGKWTQIGQTGLKYPFRERSYEFAHHVIPFAVSGNATDTLFLSVDASNAYKAIGFAVLRPKELKIFESNIYFVFGIIVGLLILFLVLNISLFFALKEKLHLWYALYIALLILVVMKNDQLDQQFLGMDSELAFRLTPYASIGAFAIAVLLHVVQSFLKKILIYQRVLYRGTDLLKANIICSAVVHAFVFFFAKDAWLENLVFGWVRVSILLSICMLIADCLYGFIKGMKDALFLFSATFVFMIGSVQRLFVPNTLSFLFPPTTFHIGIIMEVFIVSGALIYRYWMERETQRQKEDQIKIQTIQSISAEIHDNVGQVLTLANLNLKTIDYTRPSYIQDKVELAKGFIGKSIADLRNLSHILKNEVDQHMDICELVKSECRNLEEASQIKTICQIRGRAFRLDNQAQATLLRIVKEALQNIIKHSKALKVEVLVHFKRRKLFLEIRDDGIGFDPVAAARTSNGLVNIKRRCRELNATCRIESKAGYGTRIVVDMPV